MRPINEKVRELYAAYFGRTIRKQPWTPNMVCTNCSATLTSWATKKRVKMPFGVSMLWNQLQNHLEDCYFCLTDINGLSKRNRKTWKYPDLLSAPRPQPHSGDAATPKSLKPETESEPTPELHSFSTDESDGSHRAASAPTKFDQQELNDLVRDLGLPKESAELLASRLKQKDMLEHGSWIERF